jgi:hypothetical protein
MALTTSKERPMATLLFLAVQRDDATMESAFATCIGNDESTNAATSAHFIFLNIATP